MKDGRVRVGIVTPDAKIADPRFNRERATEAAKRAAADGVKVLVFPELTLTGYTCADLFFQKTLLVAAERELDAFIRETEDLDLISFIGVPVLFGGKLYNCAAAVSGGELLGLVPKSFVPDYAEFYEARHFSEAPSDTVDLVFAGRETVMGTDLLFTCSEMPALRIAAEICEDLWTTVPPSSYHATAGALLIVNLSASSETVGKAAYRRNLVTTQSARALCAYAYADAGHGESGTDLIFSSHDILAQNGTVLAESAPFAGGLSDGAYLFGEIDLDYLLNERMRNSSFRPSDEGYLEIPFSLAVTETGVSCPPPKFPFVPGNLAEREKTCELILSIQSRGLADRIARSHAKTAVIGVSGGLDSTLALIVAYRAMGLLGRSPADVVAVTMPCFGTTSRTKSNAERLAEEFGLTLRVVDIKAAVERHFTDIGHKADDFNVVYENSQARERTQVLMDLANATGGLVVGTGDLSELALGWATYNGDHMSMYGVNASVPKTLVRYLVGYYADTAERAGKEKVAAVLRDVLDTPVSPELLPPVDGEIAQKTEGIVGPYELHDYFLYHLVRLGERPAKILKLAAASFASEYDVDTIRLWLRVFLRRFFAQQFKRSCLPDGPKVGSVSFSPRSDFRMPSDATCAEWLAEIE